VVTAGEEVVEGGTELVAGKEKQPPVRTRENDF
jgi:hypothetical protein